MEVIMKRNAVTGKERPQEKDFDEAKRVVRVVPRTDDIRKYLKHPATRVGFLAEGASEWPNDQFTRRRIADGDISIERAKPEPQDEQASEQEERHLVFDPSGAKSAQGSPEVATTSTSSGVDPGQTTAPKN